MDAAPATTTAPPASGVQTLNFMDQAVDVNPSTGKVFGTRPTATNIPAPAVVSSGNAATKTQGNIAGVNNTLSQINQNQQNNQNPPTPSTPTPTTPTTPTPSTTTDNTKTSTTPTDPVLDAYTQQLKDSQAASDAAFADYKTKTDQLMSGNYPLTSDQQAMISNIQASTDRLVTQQQQINQIQQANLTMSGIRSGRERYTTESNDNGIADAMTKGLSAITDIQNKGLGLIATARQAISDNDWKQLNDSYNQFQKNQTDHTNAIKELITVQQDQEKTQAANLKAAQDAQQQAFKNNLDTLNQQLDQQKAQATVNKDLNITAPFFQYPNSSNIYDSKTGQEITSDQYKAMGGTGGDFKDIQVVDPSANAKHSAIYTEWQDAKSTGYKGSFTQYENEDANRKATKVTNNTVTYNEAKDQAQTQAASLVGKTFSQLKGNDQYVSPSDYKKGLEKWTSAGYSAADFNKQFMNYLNPADVADYGVTK